MDKKKNIADLLGDQSFHNWISKKKKTDADKWDAWIAENPDQIDLVEDAKLMLNGLSFEKQELSDEVISDSWNVFSDKLNAEIKPEGKVVSLYPKLQRVAAVTILLITSIFIFQKFFDQAEPILVKTNWNETKTIELPDGSTAILNTNSSIQYVDDWDDSVTRIVQLQGEAYFIVNKQPKGTSFQVQTENLTSTVLGTEFNFNSKRANPILSLIEGRVQLTSANQTERILEAGQTATFNVSSDKFDIKDDQTIYWSAWTTEKWSFGAATPLSEVLNRIQETYGLELQILDDSILDKQASGDVSIESLDILLEALSFLLEIEMTLQNKKLIVKGGEIPIE